jgi:hypothetical protein
VTGACLVSLGFVDKAHSACACVLPHDSAWRSMSSLSKLLICFLSVVPGVLDDFLSLGLAPRVANHFFAELLSTIIGSRADIFSSFSQRPPFCSADFAHHGRADTCLSCAGCCFNFVHARTQVLLLHILRLRGSCERKLDDSVLERLLRSSTGLEGRFRALSGSENGC